MPPHDVQLTQDEARNCGQRRRLAKSRQYCGDREIRDRAQKAVKQYRRIPRDDRVLPIRPRVVMMGSQVKLPPNVLRDVIEHCR
jgi:hypothetical protein